MSAARPTKVKVGAFLYEIRWVEEPDWPADMQDAGGITYAHNCQIWMRLGPKHDRPSVQVYREVLLHEILHACWASSMITHHDWDREREVEETAIRFTTPALLGVLRDNPPVVRWLVESFSGNR